MENEILLETEELLQRLVEAVEKLNSAPSEDTIIAFFALVAAWITIAFLLVERHEKNRPYPHNFSGGMRQRVVLAIALAGKPHILFADEPTTALDVTIQAQILDLLRDVQRKLGTATVFVTHDLGVVASMADRVAVMYAGKVVETGTCEDIFYRNAHPYTQALLKSLPSVDMNKTQRLVSIPGTPPDLLNPPKGCGFGARCTHCMKICHEEQPPVFKVGEGHEAACWLLHPDCPSVAERGEPDEQ